jgi:hypothetical protein
MVKPERTIPDLLNFVHIAYQEVATRILSREVLKDQTYQEEK